MTVKTTLNFYGRTEEAIGFYRDKIDAELVFLMRFRDAPNQSEVTPVTEDKVFHATFRIGETELMASDCGCDQASCDQASCDQASGQHSFAGFSLAINVDTPELAERYFAALSDGGTVHVPLAETFFAARYGIVVDRFGISWKIMVESKGV